MNSKSIDEKIKEVVGGELEKMSGLTSILEYRAQIQGRKHGILSFLDDFDDNIEIIRQKNRFGINIVGKRRDTIHALDKIIQKKLDNRFNDTAAQLMKNGSDDFTHARVAQFANRQTGISELLDNYDENIDYLRRFKTLEAVKE